MRHLTLAITLVLFSVVAPPLSLDAMRLARQCPSIKVSCSDVNACGNDLTFAADVDGSDVPAKLKYRWLVSAGNIVSGQGTSSVKVNTTRYRGGMFAATVEVEGLSEACERKATCTTTVICDPVSSRFIEYDEIRFSDEKAVLGEFALTLQKDATAQGYVICYGGRRGRAGEAQRRCDRAAKHLVNTRGIDPARIVTVDGGYRDRLTVELWIVPLGVMPPVASPTVEPCDVTVIKSRSKSGRPRR